MHSHEPASSTDSTSDVRAMPSVRPTEPPSSGLHDVRDARAGGAGGGDSSSSESTDTNSDSSSPDSADETAVVQGVRPAPTPGALPPHRDPSLRCAGSVLRRNAPRMPRGKPRGALAAVVEERPIQSRRHLGEVLWYPMAEIVVICDGCDFPVGYRRGGGLVAKPGRSRFARDRFLCWRCMRGGSGHLYR